LLGTRGRGQNLLARWVLSRRDFLLGLRLQLRRE
jgi:hypothetical protein